MGTARRRVASPGWCKNGRMERPDNFAFEGVLCISLYMAETLRLEHTHSTLMYWSPMSSLP